TERERKVGCPCVCIVAARCRLRIKREGRRPRTYRNVGQDRMQRMAKPDTVQRVLQGTADRACIAVRRHHCLAERRCNLIKLRLIGNTRERCVGHWSSSTTYKSAVVAIHTPRRDREGYKGS